VIEIDASVKSPVTTGLFGIFNAKKTLRFL